MSHRSLGSRYQQVPITCQHIQGSHRQAQTHRKRSLRSYRDRHMDLQRHTGRPSKSNTQTSEFKARFILDPTKVKVP